MLLIMITCSVQSYKSNDGYGDCDSCPSHSSTKTTGSSECQCDAGYYRAEDEGPEVSCTQPPSKPSHVIVVRLDETSATIEWDEPLKLGGRKELWYRYYCSKCPSPASSSPTESTFTTRRLNLAGLTPASTYTVLIFAENKVSKMESALSRYALVEFTTRPVVPLGITGLRIEGVLENGVTIAWKPSSIIEEELFYEIESLYNDTSTVVKTVDTYYTFESLKPQFIYSFRVFVKVRMVNAYGYGPWSKPLRYQAGRGLSLGPMSDDAFTYNNIITTFIYLSSDLHWSSPGPPLWIWILLICVSLIILLFTLILCSRQSRNRKRLGDCDGMDSYRNGALTPDFNASPPQSVVKNLFHGKFGLPLINYGLSHSTNYGESNCFKPYALSEFTNDVDPSSIRITEVIGSGEFGEVCKGVLQPSAYKIASADISQVQTVAIKTLKPGSSEKAKSDFLMEASIMGQFAHENVIQLIGVVTKNEPVMIVIEYMENGSLDQFLRKNDNGVLELVQILDMLRGIAAGMKYLTEKGFVHRDLAARNVLVDLNYQCKIADFGLSRGLEGTTEQEYTTNGGKIPVRWTAPEAITHRKFTAASDVWSFGVVIWEMCSFGERPYWDWTNQKVISEITLGYRLPAPMDTPVSLHNLMLDCWHIDRHKRPTFPEILKVLEKYVRQPALVYSEGICCLDDVVNISKNFSFSKLGTSPRSADDDTPVLPANLPTHLPLDEFLKHIGLGHCLLKLNVAGVNRVSDLLRLGHIDLLSCGLITEEVQMIRDALRRLNITLQRTRSRLEHYHSPMCHYSQQSQAALLSSPRFGTVPRTLSSVPASSSDSFFV
ncbi:unnamed protein product [Thelazia callipaeda]|uniref:receptor protein-tyrosine kinase n=1 Tax=Thelazia callipaeda TaxID=103827 RepID=A0A158RCG2_THECL|nr:unnamed protein product [Thelazia callipaeda]